MEMNPQRVVARARRAVGARFRPQGRTLSEGLDCIGLAAFAFDAAEGDVPRDYALRGATLSLLEPQLGRRGLVVVEDRELRMGDIAVFAPGPGQVHLAIATGASLIHADAALRKVVERPLPPPWPLVAVWRLPSEREPV